MQQQLPTYEKKKEATAARRFLLVCEKVFPSLCYFSTDFSQHSGFS